MAENNKPLNIPEEQHEFCVVDGDLFVDGQFAAQLCWDELMVNAALVQYLSASPAERAAMAEGYEYTDQIRSAIRDAQKKYVQMENGILEISDSDIITKLKESIRDFVKREYDEDLDASVFDDPTRIGIAETNAEDREDIVIDVAVNIPEKTLDMYINGEKTDTWQYSSLKAMANEIDRISFDELVSLGPESETRIEQLKRQFPMEQDFLNNPDDCFALYQLKPSPEYHQLHFTEMDILNRSAERFRERIGKELEQIENVVFDNKEAVIERLQYDGFTVIATDDPERIAVRNDFQMEAAICLRSGANWCMADSYDTKQLENRVQHRNYNMIYTAQLPDDCAHNDDVNSVLETLYFDFNVYRPEDFHGHSMSVSDVVALKRDGKITCYFTDSIGFEKLENFMDNPLRNAELMLEDDCNMIDGIINNGEKEPDEQKPSLLAQLKDCREESAAAHPSPEIKHERTNKDRER